MAKTNPTTGGFRISDELWEVLEPLIPEHVNTHRFGGGRPRVPDRTCANGIFYVLRTGCQWKALDATGICSGVHRPPALSEMGGRWGVSGFVAGGTGADELKGLDWSWLSMDGAMTKSPLSGGKTGANPTDRGKRGVKRSLLTEASGIPVGLTVDGANRHDMKLVRATVDSVPVDRPLPSPEHPHGMCLDKGYDFAEVRRTLDEFGFTAHIRSRGEEAQAIKREAGFKARRWVVERTHSWLNRFPAHFGPLRQVPRELHRLSSLRLCPHHPQSRWVIRIGSKWVYPRACGGTPNVPGASTK